MNEKQNPGTSVALTSDQDLTIAAVRQHGAYNLAITEARRDIEKQIENTEWGSGSSVMRGSSFSAAAKAALADFCLAIDAHPALHIAMFGGKPWPMASYWIDRLNKEDHFIDYDQINISADKQRREDWGAPDWATHVYETVIRKLAAFAPIEKIRSGEIQDWDRYVVVVRECNWAGGKTSGRPDPIGNAEPSKTARTRSIGRTASRAFPAWRGLEERIERATQVLEAEWEYVREDRAAERKALPPTDGAHAVRTGTGEPQAANGNGAASLPVEGEDGQVSQSADPVDEPRVFDPNLARREFFGDFNAVGITEAERHTWASDNGLPESTKEWTEQDHAKALDILRTPDRKKLSEGAGLVGLNPEQLARERFQKGMLALTVKELQQLNLELSARMDGGA